MKALLTILLVVVSLTTLLSIGFAYSGMYDVSAREGHWAPVDWLLQTTMRVSVEQRARNVEVPELTEQMKRAGVNDFEAMCVGCHGSPARPPGAMGQGLSPKAPDLSSSAQRLRVSELFWITKNGIRMTGMPAWGASHDPEEIWPVVAFMTELPGLDETAYIDYLNAAQGLGHHQEQHLEAAQSPAETTTNVAQPAHDHSTHQH